MKLTEIPPLRQTWNGHGRPPTAIYHGDGEHPMHLGGELVRLRPDGGLIHVEGVDTLISEYFSPDDPVWLSPADTTRVNAKRPRRLNLKNFNGHAEEWIPLGARGEPTRSQEDMRWMVAGRLMEYVGRFPYPGVEVDDALALRTATLIVQDHYQVPCSVVMMREHLGRYVVMARERS